MTSKREDALKLLDSNVPPGRRITSNGDRQLFLSLTNTSHETLQKNWRNPPPNNIMSACNGFVGWYAQKMGITGIESFFQLEKSLRANGKGHAWVPADGTSKPDLGDILHHRQAGTGLHVDVCIGFTTGGQLVRAAAGQILFKSPRNPDMEFDTLMRVTGTHPYDYHNLLGWLDIDKYFDAAPFPGLNFREKWAIGWWNVKDTQQYFYYFDIDGRVQYVREKQSSPFAPPPKPLSSGKYRYLDDGQLIIDWNPLDGGPTIETFTPDATRQNMSGKSNKPYGDLIGQKM
jgi:hypothetical protein